MNSLCFKLAVIFLFANASLNAASAAEVPCAVLIKADAGFKVTTKSGSIITQFKGAEDPIECGAIISTREGTAAIRTKSQVTMKLGPQTYFEFNKTEKSEDYYTLTRGQLLLQSPPQKKITVIYTTQARVDFNGGVAWVEYHSENKLTQAACFNKTFSIQNRFNTEAIQVVKAGEMSGLDFSDPRVFPKQPKVMDSAVANSLLSRLKLGDEERNEMVESVDRVYESRSKSLAVELEGWKDIDKSQEEGRSLASGTKKDAKPSQLESLETIQEREAAFVMEQFKKKVYGELDDRAVRAPASAEPRQGKAKAVKQEKIIDTEFSVQQRKQNEEKKRILDQISE